MICTHSSKLESLNLTRFVFCRTCVLNFTMWYYLLRFNALLCASQRNFEIFFGFESCRCVRLTDDGLMRVLESCKGISELYLYALSRWEVAKFLFCGFAFLFISVIMLRPVCSLTDKSYAKLGNLQDLKILDLCGAQVRLRFIAYLLYSSS